MKRLLLVSLLVLLALVIAPVTAQDGDARPIVVFISWDGSSGWIVERLLSQDKLPNLQRLIEQGVYVRRVQGNFPTVTAPGHAAVYTGAFGNVNGVTGNGVPNAPYSEYPFGACCVSGFRASNLLVEPIWVTAARSGWDASLISVTQSGPFEMYTTDDFVSPQGTTAFGDFSEQLFIIDPYESRLARPAMLTGGSAEGELAITDSDGGAWTNLPEGAAFRAVTLGGAAADADLGGAENIALQGLLIAPDGATFDHIAVSADGDYSTAAILRATPFTDDSSQFSAPVNVTICQGERCTTGYTHFRLTELAADGSSFTLWHTYQSDMTNYVTEPSRVQDLLDVGGAFTGNGSNGGIPFVDAGELPNIIGEIAFQVNDWFFNNLVAEIERNEADFYASYSPFPDEWFHYYYGYMDGTSPFYTEELSARAWRYTDAMYANLDGHLGRVIDALEGTGREWNIVMFTDHGFHSVGRQVFLNRVLGNAGLLTVTEQGAIDPAGTLAYTSGPNVYINAADVHLDGLVAREDYDDVVAMVTEALLSFRDPQTGTQVVAAVHTADDLAAQGGGGVHGADLYVDLAPGYNFRFEAAGAEPLVVPTELGTGSHDRRALLSDELLGYAVLSGDQIVDGVVVPLARSIDWTPTIAAAVGIEPAAHWQGTVHQDWIVSP